MIKKYFYKIFFLCSLIVSILLISNLNTIVSATETIIDSRPMLVVDSKLAQAGEVVSIEIKTENNPGILNAVLTLSFDDSIILTDIQKGPALSKLDFTPPGKNTYGTYNSPCNILWDALDDADSSNGTILMLTFLLPENAEPGIIYNINLSYVYGDIADGDLNPVEFDIINGSIEVLDYTPGDVNGDGRINGTDITLIRRYITGGYGVNITTKAADVNNDGRINGTDVTLIRRYITGGYGVELKPSYGCFQHTLIMVNAVSPTCTVDGNIEYWKCTSCNKLYSDEDGKNQITQSDIVDKSSGHTEVIDQPVTETCTETGLTEGKHCSVCSIVLVPQQVIPAANHNYDAVVSNPTCLEEGYTTYTCSCGDSYIDNYIDALGHNIVIDDAISATCNTTGLTEGKHCSICDIVIVEQHVINKLEHSMSMIEAVNATCTENGNIDYWICNSCNKYYSDESGNTEILLTETIINATGHTYSDAWQFNETVHYHLAVCGCSVKTNVTKHTLDSNGCCVVCDYESKIKLETPIITTVEYDKISWTEVENASSYTIVVNGDYFISETNEMPACISNALKKNGDHITVAGEISIVIRANGTDRYLTSDNSSIYNYYYVPEKTNLTTDEASLTHKGIGYGYNLIENEAINAEKISKNKILNIEKLLTIGEYYNPSITSGCLDSYHYSSVDELYAHFDASITAKGGLSIANIAKYKLNYSYSTSANYNKYTYNEVLMLQDSILYKTYGIKDYNDEDLVHCLTEDFLNDVKLANSIGIDEWNQYMYNKYGTHVILGVATGATYTAQYVVSTNKSEYAQKIKHALSVEATDISFYSKILKGDLGIGVSLGEGKSWSGEETEARFDIFWVGSTGGGVTSPDNIDSAISKFEAGLNESNAVVVRFTTDGAISIGSLIAMIDASLGAQFENYVSDKGDEAYQALYSQYTKTPTLKSKVENINGENVFYIDLSPYQNAGNLDDAYNSNLLEGVFTVYPKMMGKRIDKIVVNGAFDQYNENLIDGFSIKLAESWNRNVTIEINNLGVVPILDNGLIDISEFDYDLTLDYSGINAIEVSTNRIEFYSSINENDYKFELILSDNETIDFTTSQIFTELNLPIVERDGYTFNGWKDGNGVEVTDDNGKIISEYVLGSSMITLEAKWIPKEYSIILNNEGATIQGTTEIKEQYEYIFTDKNGTEISNIVVPQKTGYTFEGFYLKINSNNSSDSCGETLIIDKDGNIIVDAGIFKENTTIYALWKPDKYVVTMMSEQTVFGKYYVIYGEGFYNNPECTVSIKEIDLPSKIGYKFNGFFTDKGIMIINADGLIVSTVTNDYKTISSDVIIESSWISNSYVLVYDSNGGSGSMSSINRQYDDGLFIGNNKFTRVGYEFKEWNTSKDGLGTRYNENSVDNLSYQDNVIVTVYAIWKPINYIIEYDSNGGEGVMESLYMTYDVEKKLTSNTFTGPHGKSFAGWLTQDGVPYENEETVINLTATNDTKVILYAQWANGSYEIKFDPNGGTVSVTSMQVTYDSQYGTLPVPTRIGYTFIGWYNNGTLVEENTKVTLDKIHTLTASWDANIYTITYDSNGGTGSMISSTYTYDKSGKLSLNTFTRNGWTFTGWDTKRDGTGIDYADNDSIINLTSELNGNITLFAMWKENNYTVTFDANGGLVSQNSKTVTFTKSYGTLPTPTREYYKFLGWYTQLNGGTLVTEDSSVTTYNHHTLYASWEQCEYVVTFNTNGGTSVNQAIIAFGSPVLFSNYITSREGYIFEGWYADSSFSNKYSDNYVNSSNVDLIAYAKWTPKQYNCKIVFSGDFTVECQPTILITHIDGTHSMETLVPHIERVQTSFGSGVPTWANIPVGEFEYTFYYGEFVELMAYEYSFITESDLIIMGTTVGKVKTQTTYHCDYQKQIINNDVTITVVFTMTDEIIENPYL